MVSTSFVRRCLAGLALVMCLGVASPAETAWDRAWERPGEAARPWVFWYWMHASVSAAGITADLEAMKAAGIGGAYLVPIKGPANPPLFEPVAAQLTPEWWALVRHAFREADRLGVKLGMMVADGFATAGGPWITPEQSMQKLTWSRTTVSGGAEVDMTLPAPPQVEGFYREVAVLAYPARLGEVSTRTVPVVITTNAAGADPAAVQRLADPASKETFRATEPCWLQFAFSEPFTVRSLQIRRGGNNSHAQAFELQASEDGATYRSVADLRPPRHGWLDVDSDVTHAVPETTARFFRLRWDPAMTEAGAEDLDSAKWRSVLRVQSVELSSAPRLHQFESKNGEVWRISPATTPAQVPAAGWIKPAEVVDLTAKVGADGRLRWAAPAGAWTIVRIGHTSTGRHNETGGAARGLECDKLDPVSVRWQLQHWFGEVLRQIGPDQGRRALAALHVDSWECGSQNWSPRFPEIFAQKRGYALGSYLLAMTGVPVGSAADSERVLRDVRTTISEQMTETFYGTLRALAQAEGLTFTGECTAPVMVADGLRHFDYLDLPMGEFWLRSPTHDKPQDMRDAISGAHIYGKPVVAAEAFTELRLAWDETPALLKPLGDRQLALGINRFVLHVFVHNPWLDRRPGMILDGVGTYFQRDQTWWLPGRAYFDYLARCSAVLQQGVPVVDLAVFSGEDVPRRSVLPQHLIETLPGPIGGEAVERERRRLANTGQPTRELPAGVLHAANTLTADGWPDPLRGYAFDTINPDALLRLATVEGGRIVLPGGASYALLILPGARPQDPGANTFSEALLAQLARLVGDGATVVTASPSQHDALLARLPAGPRLRVIAGPLRADDLSGLGLARDFEAFDAAGRRLADVAWTHRRSAEGDVYFVSHEGKARSINLSLRASGRVEVWDPVSGVRQRVTSARVEDGRLRVPVALEENGACFVVITPDGAPGRTESTATSAPTKVVATLDQAWTLTFDPAFGGPTTPLVWSALTDWTLQSDERIKFYSGTVVYEQRLTLDSAQASGPRWLELGRVGHIAEVTVNGQPCGVAWTAPWRVEVTSALRPGANIIRIAVTNPWANRLIGDRAKPESERLARVNASERFKSTTLLPSGLFGPVRLLSP